MKNLWRTVLFYEINRLFCNDWISTFSNISVRTIPRRFSKGKKNRQTEISTKTNNERKQNWFCGKRKQTHFSCGLKIHFDRFSHEKNSDLLISGLRLHLENYKTERKTKFVFRNWNILKFAFRKVFDWKNKEKRL